MSSLSKNGVCEFSAFSILFPCGGEGGWGHLQNNEGGGSFETLHCNHFHLDCKHSLSLDNQ